MATYVFCGLPHLDDSDWTCHVARLCGRCLRIDRFSVIQLVSAGREKDDKNAQVCLLNPGLKFLEVWMNWLVTWTVDVFSRFYRGFWLVAKQASALPALLQASGPDLIVRVSAEFQTFLPALQPCNRAALAHITTGGRQLYHLPLSTSVEPRASDRWQIFNTSALWFAFAGEKQADMSPDYLF